MHPDEQQSQAEEQAECAIDDRLHQQESADPLARLVDELGGGDDLPVACQPDDAIAQLLALLKHEDDQDDGQRQLAEILHQRARNVEIRDSQTGLCGSMNTAVGRAAAAASTSSLVGRLRPSEFAGSPPSSWLMSTSILV